jgi:hypothetical protein
MVSHNRPALAADMAKPSPNAIRITDARSRQPREAIINGVQCRRATWITRNYSSIQDWWIPEAEWTSRVLTLDVNEYD